MLYLTETKAHLRIDHHDEDGLLQDLIEAAVDATAQYLNRDAAALWLNAPAPVKAAALLLVGDLYANREAQSDRTLYANATYERLLNPYRVHA